MTRFADRFLVESSRLKDWNYSNPGIYFITICTLNHGKFFGKISNNKIILSEVGNIAKQCLEEIPSHFKYTKLLNYVVMPNHVHFLLNVETPDLTSLQNNKIIDENILLKSPSEIFQFLNKKSKQTIPKVVQQYKSSVKRKINKQEKFFAWQSRYHDTIVKNQKDLIIIKKYIKNNLINWEKDKFHN
jgi:putative transposase